MQIVLLLLGCSQLAVWQSQIEQARKTVDGDLDGYSPSEGDCDETCEQQLVSGGSTVCYGWFFHPMDAVELAGLSLDPGLDQDCDGVADGKQPGIDFDGDDFDGVALPGDVMDCDDFDAAVYPGAEDACDDGVDQDCDGADAPCGEAE